MLFVSTHYQECGTKENTVESENNNIKKVDSLRASKIQNSPCSSDIPNTDEDADNYNIIIIFGLFVTFIK